MDTLHCAFAQSEKVFMAQLLSWLPDRGCHAGCHEIGPLKAGCWQPSRAASQVSTPLGFHAGFQHFGPSLGGNLRPWQASLVVRCLGLRSPSWARLVLTCQHDKRSIKRLNAFKNILQPREIAHTLIVMDATKAQQNGRGRGRPRLEDGVDTIPVTVRMTAPQKEKLTRLGGSGWVRDRIDKAKEPAPKE